MSGDPGNRSESGTEEGEHRQRQPAHRIKNQRTTKAQDRILNRMAKFTKRMPLGAHVGPGARRVVKTEHTALGTHPRFVVTHLTQTDRYLYDRVYCAHAGTWE